MDTLKNIRAKLGLGQAELAKVINTNVSNYCNYENGQALPILEDMLILEKNVEERITWDENMTTESREAIVEGIKTLLDFYPVSSVLNFGQKALKEGYRLGRPESVITFYADAARGLTEAPLLPPTFYQRKTKE